MLESTFQPCCLLGRGLCLLKGASQSLLGFSFLTREGLFTLSVLKLFSSYLVSHPEILKIKFKAPLALSTTY